MQKKLSANDVLSIEEFSSLFGFPSDAIIEAIQRNRSAIKKDFYSVHDLTIRWDCSRGTVHNVLREHEASLLDLGRTGKAKGRKLVSAASVERIERLRTKLASAA